ncbi:MFS transporter [Pseudonocardiaceae bacterium YIM PH 21723]|nr:MFS transporter [Pseudonocardiaceae bacterium YIM PH 21723]
MTNTASPVAGVSRGILFLMSLATALAVSGNSFAQPLLALFTRELGVSDDQAALIMTAGQLGYAAGLALLLPLADLVERRRLATGMFAATALFLALSGSATGGTMLVITTCLSALTSVVAQVIVTYAAAVAAPEHRGSVVGTVMTGLLLGGLLSRTAAGAVADLSGWRVVYWVAALLTAAMAVTLWRSLPPLRTSVGLSYTGILRSTFSLFRTEPLLRSRAVIGACSLASMNCFWTVVSFLLSGQGWSELRIGLLGLLGVAGAMAMNLGGRLADRGHAQRVAAVAGSLLLLAWLPLWLGESSAVLLIVGILLLLIGTQGLLSSNMNTIYSLRPELRNRLNSAFMTCYFIGGAAGAALAGRAWSAVGWAGVSALGALLAAVALSAWAAERWTVTATPAHRARLAETLRATAS